ncbi:hypothetical protein F2P56_004049 [Juglans regia]|uniref:Retrotransposon Copia-like N-terminal domain-containing protein n=1 Tax=Juglans regia TaxID=51240 RepID=A0A833Y7H6_JUGRE|nr:hypothetical protein F2P56_004049 [Juglans regia]
MEDPTKDSSDSTSHHSDASEIHTNLNTNTFRATPMACFLNLSDLENPFQLDNGDNPAVLLVTDPLTFDNYPTWSRAMRHALRAKNKVGFVMGDIPCPSNPDDPLLEPWERCNDMVASWLQNSISASIKSSVVFFDDAGTYGSTSRTASPTRMDHVSFNSSTTLLISSKNTTLFHIHKVPCSIVTIKQPYTLPPIKCFTKEPSTSSWIATSSEINFKKVVSSPLMFPHKLNWQTSSPKHCLLIYYSCTSPRWE